MKNALRIAVPVLALSLLAGCGDSSTATNDSTSTPVVATSTTSASSASADPSTARASGTSATSTPDAQPAAGGGAAVAPPTPVEVSGVPRAERPENEKAFLADLDHAGIKVDGLIADQVVASARRHCDIQSTGQQDLITPAVAGQLVELKTTTLPPQQVESAIIDGAQAHFCK